MSSLLQFTGNVTEKGVGLQLYLTDKKECYSKEIEPVSCQKCGKTHPQIYIAYRKPRGMFGRWVVFRLNGEDTIPDLSVPLNVTHLPRDAKALSATENSSLWHS